MSKKIKLSLGFISILAQLCIPNARGNAQNLPVYELTKNPDKEWGLSQPLVPAAQIKRVFVTKKPIASSLMLEYLDENGKLQTQTLEVYTKPVYPLMAHGKLADEKLKQLESKITELKEAFGEEVPIAFRKPDPKSKDLEARVEENWKRLFEKCRSAASENTQSDDNVLPTKHSK